MPAATRLRARTGLRRPQHILMKILGKEFEEKFTYIGYLQSTA
jgi:hypothetical protein